MRPVNAFRMCSQKLILDFGVRDSADISRPDWRILFDLPIQAAIHLPNDVMPVAAACAALHASVLMQ